MSNPSPRQFDQVSVVCKANVYFDGKVVSHTVLFPGGVKKTVGLIYPGTFTFNTAAPETMEIIAGECRVRRAGEADWQTVAAGSTFAVAANSHFDIAVAVGICEYICAFG